jgi:hypothetical protein
MGNYLLFFEVLTSLFQSGYDTLLFQTKLLNFGIIACHSLHIILETLQIIVGFLVELVKFDILLLQVLNFPNNLLCLFQLIRQVLVFMLDPIHLSFDFDQFFVIVLQNLLHYL